MGGFFNGWRRKIGLVMLVMACVFMFGWIRSTVTSDYIRFFPVQFHGVLIVSAEHTIRLQTWSGPKPEQEESKPRKKPRRRKPEYQPERFGLHLNEELTRRMPVGSSIATVFQPEMGEFKRYHEYSVPYRSITIPLTLISIWLLLSNPSKSYVRARAPTK